MTLPSATDPEANPTRLARILAAKIPGLNEVSRDVVVSSVVEETQDGGVAETVEWLEGHRQSTQCMVELVPLRTLDNWHFDDHLNLRHDSGKFFSIEGLRVSTDVGPVHQWAQPIIYQPEIGILGIICQKREGVLQFLLQAKIEPGNIGHAQLSPTLQATRSNYTRVHEGQYPPFLEYFIEPVKQWIVFDQLQSEQGGRFFKKRNRNMLLVIPPEETLSIPDNFRWMTLGQIKRLVTMSNTINMNTRTVLSCLSIAPFEGELSSVLQEIRPDGDDSWRGLYDSLLKREQGLHSLEGLLSHLTELKTRAVLEVERCDLDQLDDWEVREKEIANRDDRFFRVIGVRVRIDGREVQSWCQPLIRPRHQGLVGFIVRPIDGVYHILVQAKMEAGNFDTLELAPTVQCITGNYRRPTYDIPYIQYFLNPGHSQTLFDSMQSEEGGRFFQEENRYMALEVGDEFTTDVVDNYIWMTLGQAKLFIKFNNYFNVEARTLITCFSPI